MEYNKRKKQADGGSVVRVNSVIGGRESKRIRKIWHDGRAPIFKSLNAIKLVVFFLDKDTVGS